jgi:preprotein translocase subunit SecG
MFILLTIVHVIVCLFLVIVVLLQSGKAADLAGAFGGMGSQTAFGPRGSATVLSKATTIAAALFMVTSLSLSIMASRSAGTGTSVVERSKGKAGAPATPAAPAPVAVPAQPSGQPSVSVTPVGPGGKAGETRTMPIDLSKMPQAPAPAQTQQPQKK